MFAQPGGPEPVLPPVTIFGELAPFLGLGYGSANQNYRYNAVQSAQS